MAYHIINIALQFEPNEGEKRSDRYIKLFNDAYHGDSICLLNKKEKIFIHEMHSIVNNKGRPVLVGALRKGIFPSDIGINTKNRTEEETPEYIKEDIFHSVAADFYFYPHKHYCVVSKKIPCRMLEKYFKVVFERYLEKGEALSVNVYPYTGNIERIRAANFFNKIKLVITLSNEDQLSDRAKIIERLLKERNSNHTQIEFSAQDSPIPQDDWIQGALDIISRGNGFAVADISNEIGTTLSHIDSRETPAKIPAVDEPDHVRPDFIESLLPQKDDIDEL